MRRCQGIAVGFRRDAHQPLAVDGPVGGKAGNLLKKVGIVIIKDHVVAMRCNHGGVVIHGPNLRCRLHQG